MQKPTTPILRLERVFDASPEALWAAWTDPKQYAKWLNPAPGLDLVIHEFDVRPGGRMRFDMPQPDGNPHPQEGVFHELDPPRRLVSGSEDRSFLIEARFEPVGKRTRLVVEVTGVPPDWHEAATTGWNQGFDKLVELLRGELEMVVTRLVRAPRARVFDAFGDPEQLAKWFGPDGFVTTTHEIDLRPQGVWRFTMRGPDGREHPNWVRYLEVERPARIVWDHGQEPDDPWHRTTITLDDAATEGGGTRVTLRATFPDAAGRRRAVEEHGAVEGARQTLGKLAAHVERDGVKP